MSAISVGDFVEVFPEVDGWDVVEEGDRGIVVDIKDGTYFVKFEWMQRQKKVWDFSKEELKLCDDSA